MKFDIKLIDELPAVKKLAHKHLAGGTHRDLSFISIQQVKQTHIVKVEKEEDKGKLNKRDGSERGNMDACVPKLLHQCTL